MQHVSDSMSTVRRWIADGAGFLLAALGVLLVCTLPASADTSQAGLPPDKVAFCVTHPPFALAQQEAGYVVSFQHVNGSPGANDWACHYLVKPGGVVPVPFQFDMSIDFNALCKWMYPGATSDWSTSRHDWACIGKPGRTYTNQSPNGVMNYVDD